VIQVQEPLSVEELKTVYRGVAKRYDLQHAIVTAKADELGRRILVENSVKEGDSVLDCGCGTGATGILAARKAGPEGRIVMFDLSEAMLEVARRKVAQENLQDRVSFQTGDLVHLPFESDTFDVALSTYSLCPVYDPEKGALELYRVTKPGGKVGIAHSAEPLNPVVKWLADRIEGAVWRFPWLSMGCRAVNVLPALKEAGGQLVLSRYIGIPLWPFFVFIIEKPGKTTKQSHIWH